MSKLSLKVHHPFFLKLHTQHCPIQRQDHPFSLEVKFMQNDPWKQAAD